MKRSKINLSRQDIKYYKIKNLASSSLFDLAVEIDGFLDEVKKSNLSNEEKAKILNAYKKLLVNISDTFKKAGDKFGIEFNEPFSVEVLRGEVK
jgi:hypothetical protein